MTDTPNRPPLWDVMEQARDAVIAAHHPFAREEQCLAAEIRALRDWLVPEMPHPGESEFWPDADTEREWQHNQRLRALLTEQAEIAESGNG